jgi:transposase
VEPSRSGATGIIAACPLVDRRRQDLLQLLDQLNQLIEELRTAIVKEAEKKPEVQLLMTHPGVGLITGLAFVLVIGNPKRFRCGKQIGSYLGLIPSEDSSAGSQKLRHISKQGNWLFCFLLIEATHNTVRLDPDWRRHFLHLAMRRGRSIAQVMVARKLAVRLFWMRPKTRPLADNFSARKRRHTIETQNQKPRLILQRLLMKEQITLHQTAPTGSS